ILGVRTHDDLEIVPAMGSAQGCFMVRSTRIASAIAVCLAAVGSPVSAQSLARDGTSLEFRGFHPGDRLSDIAARVEQLDGSRLRCDRAKVDRRITECR